MRKQVWEVKKCQGIQLKMVDFALFLMCSVDKQNKIFPVLHVKAPHVYSECLSAVGSVTESDRSTGRMTACGAAAAQQTTC